MTYEIMRNMTRNYAKLLSCLFAFVFAWIYVSAPLAQAQESAGVKVQPALIEERADPGQIFSSTLRVTNLGPNPQTFYVVTRDISGLSAEGLPVFAAEGEETGYEVSAWIKISGEPIVIPGGQTREIPFSIEVPQNAGPGGHFGSIFLTSTPERPEETGAGVAYQVGTIVNLRISGEIFEEARIREFSTDKIIYGRPDVKFSARVENIGNVLVRPRGPLEISDFFGNQVAALRVNDAGAAVFPESVRQFETSWHGEKLAFGRYQAVMSLVYGEDGRKTISAVLSFWVLPLNVILPVVGGILGLILAVFIFVKFYIRRRLRALAPASGEEASMNNPGWEQQEFLRSRLGSTPSRLTLIAIVMLVFTLLFLAALFFLFA